MVIVKIIVPYIRIIRPLNAAITVCAVLLGMWLTSETDAVGPLAAALLMVTAAAAAGYGNIVNDILDVKSDRVSHPGRPLASGAMSERAASIYAAALVVVSIGCAASVSAFYAAAAAVPVVLLTLYSLYFKRTKIIGNIIVATLTAYALLYGSLLSPNINIIIAPAVLAFLLNFCREIIKDVQDAEGDRAAGWKTSAELPPGVIRAVLMVAGGVYAALVLMPSLVFGHFGAFYTAACLAAVVPVHIYWMILVRSDVNKNAGRVGAALKIEMVAGLAALALDHFCWKIFLPAVS